MTAETKRTPIITADIYGTVLTLTFNNGEELRVDAATLPDDIRTAAMMHGLKQKCIDGAAIARNTDTGRSATVQDKFEAVKEIVDRLTGPAPSWNKTREGESASQANLLVRAIMRLQDKPRDVVVAWLEGKDKDQKAALRKNPKVAEMIAQIQRENAGDTSATDAMLDELGNMG